MTAIKNQTKELGITMKVKRQLDRRTIKGKLEQSERHVKNGKELIMRVTKQLKAALDYRKVLEAQLQSAQAIIGAIIMHTESDMEDGSKAIVINKSEVEEIINTKTIEWKNEGSLYTFKVSPKEEETQNEESNEASNETDNTDKESNPNLH